VRTKRRKKRKLIHKIFLLEMLHKNNQKWEREKEECLEHYNYKQRCLKEIKNKRLTLLIYNNRVLIKRIP
jgi:hypothetical protein